MSESIIRFAPPLSEAQQIRRFTFGNVIRHEGQAWVPAEHAYSALKAAAEVVERLGAELEALRSSEP